MPLSPGAGAGLPVCGVCSGGNVGTESLVVTTFAGSVTVDPASLLDRLRSGQFQGSDWVVGAQGVGTPLAAHPAIAPLYVRGEFAVPAAAPAPAAPPAVVVAAPKRKPYRPRFVFPIWRILKTVTALGIVGGLAAAGVHYRAQLPGWAEQASQLLLPTVEAPSGAAVVAPPSPDTPMPDRLASVAAAEGIVEEPLAFLAAQTLEAWAKGGPAGLAEALRIARRGVARSTTDPDAVALLAVLAAQTGTEPGLTLLAGQQAATWGGGGAASQLGRAALALGNADPLGAAAAVGDCAGAGDLVCRLVAANALAAAPGREVQAIAAFDALAADWPEHLDPPRTAALIAASNDHPSAEARLATLSDTDPFVAGARGVLEARNGHAEAATQIAADLLDAAPAELRIAVARIHVHQGNVEAALALVVPLDTEKPLRTPRSIEVRLLIAQARWLAARDHPEAIPAARDAVARLVELGRSDPAVAQVRALVARTAGERAEEARAWTAMDETGRSGPDLARVYKTQLALMHEAKAPGSEMLLVAEKARAADPSDPNVHVWLVEVQLLGHGHLVAIESLRRAVEEVDGQFDRRRLDLVTLETGAPAKSLRAHLEDELGNEGRFATSLPLARATCSWLAGDLAGARSALSAAPNPEDDAESLALRARLYEGQEQHERAMRDWDRVAAQRPKQGGFLLAALRAHVRAGQLGTAMPIAELVRASKVNPALGPAMLAEVQLASGDRAGAILLLEQALAADPLDLVSRARLRELRKDG